MTNYNIINYNEIYKYASSIANKNIAYELLFISQTLHFKFRSLHNKSLDTT